MVTQSEELKRLSEVIRGIAEPIVQEEVPALHTALEPEATVEDGILGLCQDFVVKVTADNVVAGEDKGL